MLVMISYASPSPLLSSYVIHFQGGISALYCVSYGGLLTVNTISLERLLAAVALLVTVPERSHARAKHSR